MTYLMFDLHVHSSWCSRRKKSCDQLIMIQLGWNVIIKALWGAESSKNKTCQGEQPTLSVPPGYFTYLQPKQLNPPTSPLAPYCGNDQEQFVTLAQPICCFCFSDGGWRGVDWWVGWCWARWGMRKWWDALTTNYCPSVITVGWALATARGQTAWHSGHLYIKHWLTDAVGRPLRARWVRRSGDDDL